MIINCLRTGIIESQPCHFLLFEVSICHDLIYQIVWMEHTKSTHKYQRKWALKFQTQRRKVILKKILSFLQFRLVMTVRFILAGDGNQSISFLIWPESGQHWRHRAATEPFILLITVQTKRGFCHRHPENTFQIQGLQSITAPGAVTSPHTPGLEIAQQILLRRQHFLIIITILFEHVKITISSDL